MIVKTYCGRMDHGGSGVLAPMENGRVVKIEGDRYSSSSRGTLCAKGLAQIKRLHPPDRLRDPMKRLGEMGNGSASPGMRNEPQRRTIPLPLTSFPIRLTDSIEYGIDTQEGWDLSYSNLSSYSSLESLASFLPLPSLLPLWSQM
jgi:hypothetical protein